MAKQRCLPTSFFKDPDVMALSNGDVRLILVGLVLNADDEGRGLADARILGREFDYPPDQVEAALQEIETYELAQCYHVGRHGYYSLCRWREWQTLSKPTPSRYPAPPRASLTENSHETPGFSQNPQGNPEKSWETLSEGEGEQEKERNRSEGEGRVPLNVLPFPPQPVTTSGTSASQEIEKVTGTVAECWEALFLIPRSCRQLDAIGGESYLLELLGCIPTSGNAEYYARLVSRTSVLRQLIHAAGQIAAIAYQEDGDAEQAVEKAEQLIFTISQRRQGKSDLVPVEQVVNEYISDLEKLQYRHDSITGIPTGFHDLDQLLGGLQKSDLLILAARPGQGKTSLALNIAHHAVYKHNAQTALFSLEMSRKQLMQRLFSMESGIDQQRLRLGWLHQDDWQQTVTAGDVLAEGQLWIDDTAAISLETMRSRARRLKAQVGLDLIVVDYLQLMDASVDGKHYQNREREIARISSGLKALAKELEVPVLALAQLSRAVESRASKVPQLSDLREGGSIENDADVVLFIYRDEQQNEDGDTAASMQQIADLIIAKHRNGPVGFVRLAWKPGQTKFLNLEASPSKA